MVRIPERGEIFSPAERQHGTALHGERLAQLAQECRWSMELQLAGGTTMLRCGQNRARFSSARRHFEESGGGRSVRRIESKDSVRCLWISGFLRLYASRLVAQSAPGR